MIVLHAVILWLWIPPVMTFAAKKYEHNFGHSNIAKNLIYYLLFLTIAMCGMLISVKVLTGFSLKSLLRIELFMGLSPIYTWFLFAWFAQLYRKQRMRTVLLQADRDRSAWRALVAQLNPHFLFNTLNTLEHLIDIAPDRAKICLQRLSNLYRRILEGSKKPFVPLRNEIDLIEDYLFLQKERFEEKLEATVVCSDKLYEMPFPPSLLLTCVENAIKHGLEALGEPSPLRVEIRSESPSYIEFRVDNKYPSRQSQIPSNSGYGLNHIRERLELLYKGEAKFEFTMHDGLATAKGHIPVGKVDAV